MINELFFIGAPVPFKPGVKIYPPTVKQVIEEGLFGHYEKILTYSQEQIEDEFLEANQPLDVYPTPFEFMLNNCYHNKQYETLCKKAFEFFIHEQVSFAYEQKIIIVGEVVEVLKAASSLEDFVLITEDDFFAFQNIIRQSCGEKPVEKPVVDENPAVAEIKRKARYRDRLKAKQAAKNKNGISLFAMIVSICCMGLGISPLNIGEMSYVAMKSVMQKYQEKEKYDLDIKSLLAGADSKKIKPKYWISNFED